MKHNDYRNLAMLTIQKSYPMMRMWSNETGCAYSIPSVKNLISAALSMNIIRIKNAMRGLRLIKYGKDGSSDILGIMPGGKIICIEIKVGKDKQREDQKMFQDMIESRDGIYIIIDDKTQLETQIENKIGIHYDRR